MKVSLHESLVFALEISRLPRSIAILHVVISAVRPHLHLRCVVPGFRFLECRYLLSVLHHTGDLATRNVLVDSTNTPLVSDFGLSRDLISSDYYQMADEGNKLPLRWCSMETIVHQRFSEASDVWSYGITCHEIFTGAATPYRGWMNSYVIERVLDGYRLPRPHRCPEYIYNEVMAPCFSSDPTARPTFVSLVEVLFELALANPTEFTTNSNTIARVRTQQSSVTRDTPRPPPQGRLVSAPTTPNAGTEFLYLDPIEAQEAEELDPADADEDSAGFYSPAHLSRPSVSLSNHSCAESQAPGKKYRNSESLVHPSWDLAGKAGVVDGGVTRHSPRTTTIVFLPMPLQGHSIHYCEWCPKSTYRKTPGLLPYNTSPFMFSGTIGLFSCCKEYLPYHCVISNPESPNTFGNAPGFCRVIHSLCSTCMTHSVRSILEAEFVRAQPDAINAAAHPMHMSCEPNGSTIPEDNAALHHGTSEATSAWTSAPVHEVDVDSNTVHIVATPMSDSEGGHPHRRNHAHTNDYGTRYEDTGQPTWTQVAKSEAISNAAENDYGPLRNPRPPRRVDNGTDDAWHPK
eukprot:m.808070 g.808070  ORF g.808070 m.808070 type:complete len:573 (-) comp23381_c1_seq17:2749-4467(-)